MSAEVTPTGRGGNGDGHWPRQRPPRLQVADFEVSDDGCIRGSLRRRAGDGWHGVGTAGGPGGCGDELYSYSSTAATGQSMASRFCYGALLLTLLQRVATQRRLGRWLVVWAGGDWQLLGPASSEVSALASAGPSLIRGERRAGGHGRAGRAGRAGRTVGLAALWLRWQHTARQIETRRDGGRLGRIPGRPRTVWACSTGTLVCTRTRR